MRSVRPTGRLCDGPGWSPVLVNVDKTLTVGTQFWSQEHLLEGEGCKEFSRGGEGLEIE